MPPSFPVTNTIRETSIFNQNSYLPNQNQPESFSTPLYEHGVAGSTSDNVFNPPQPTPVEQPDFSFTNGV